MIANQTASESNIYRNEIGGMTVGSHRPGLFDMLSHLPILNGERQSMQEKNETNA